MRPGSLTPKIISSAPGIPQLLVSEDMVMFSRCSHEVCETTMRCFVSASLILRNEQFPTPPCLIPIQDPASLEGHGLLLVRKTSLRRRSQQTLQTRTISDRHMFLINNSLYQDTCFSLKGLCQRPMEMLQPHVLWSSDFSLLQPLTLPSR